MEKEFHLQLCLCVAIEKAVVTLVLSRCSSIVSVQFLQLQSTSAITVDASVLWPVEAVAVAMVAWVVKVLSNKGFGGPPFLIFPIMGRGS